MIDAARDNPNLAEGRKQLIDAAREMAAKPIAKRVYRYEDVGKYRTWLDGRAKAMGGYLSQAGVVRPGDVGLQYGRTSSAMSCRCWRWRIG